MIYREFTCAYCGKKAIDMSKTRSKKYCSPNCSQKQWYRNHGIGTEIKTPSCIHNKEIRCLERKCGTCGWNPKVEQKRKEALLNGC